jgi:2-keto-4-pentenoate hydratase/2-oxohepta-3-ene-1,7-dioic acid hydratase in catechol pathway
MKLCRFNKDRVGLIDGEQVIDITEVARPIIARNADLRFSDPLIAGLAELRTALSSGVLDFVRVPLNTAELKSPVFRPGKIVGAPVNYQAHIDEMHASNASPGHDIPDIQRAGLFLKASSSLAGPSDAIPIRFPDLRTDHEIELVAIIGRTASDVTPADALDYVAGYALGLDITLRGAADRSFRKSMDGYSVVGPWLTTADEIATPDALQLELSVNGEVRQSTNTADMKLKTAGIISFASQYYTLYPGDIIFTGTPQGVGPIRPGDTLLASCEELGKMTVETVSHTPVQHLVLV